MTFHYEDYGHSVMPASAELAALASAFSLARTDVRWREVERTRGVYDWSRTDVIVERLLGASITPLLILDSSNPLYCPLSDPSCLPVSRDAVAGYARMAHAAVGRYKGRGILWELWNEPNMPRWNNATQYAALVQAAVALVRGDPATSREILLGPAATAQHPEGGGATPHFVSDLAELGALGELDGISVHPYDVGGPEMCNEDLARLRAALRASNVTAPAVNSEAGWATCSDLATGATTVCVGGASPDAVTEEEQAQRLGRRRLLDALHGVPVSIVYAWRDDGGSCRLSGADACPWNSTMGESNYGLLRATETSFVTPKPAFTAAVAVTKAIGRRPFVRRLATNSSDSTYVLGFADEMGGGVHAYPPAAAQPQLPVRMLAAWTDGTARGAEPSGVSVTQTGSEHQIGCSGRMLAKAAVFNTTDGCEDLCLSTPHCRSFVNFTGGACSLWLSTCVLPRTETDCSYFGRTDCLGAASYTVAAPPLTVSFTLPETSRETPPGCFTAVDYLGVPQPGRRTCATAEGVVAIEVSEAPLYLMPEA